MGSCPGVRHLADDKVLVDSSVRPRPRRDLSRAALADLEKFQPCPFKARAGQFLFLFSSRHDFLPAGLHASSSKFHRAAPSFPLAPRPQPRCEPSPIPSTTAPLLKAQVSCITTRAAALWMPCPRAPAHVSSTSASPFPALLSCFSIL